MKSSRNGLARVGTKSRVCIELECVVWFVGSCPTGRGVEKCAFHAAVLPAENSRVDWEISAYNAASSHHHSLLPLLLWTATSIRYNRITRKRGVQGAGA